MKYGSLFTGIGGFDLAFNNVGMEGIWQCEIDRSCQKLLQKHFGIKLYDDVRKINSSAEPVDLLAGGFPCQDLSIAGKRAGLDGERSGLWFEFARIIKELKPGWVIAENVPGLLSSHSGRDFAVVIRGLVELGYGVAWRILDAQYFGIPQRRRRVFIVGHLGDGRSAEVLFERESSPWDTAPYREPRQEAPSTFTVRTGKDGGGKGYLGSESAMTLGGQPQWLDTVGSLQARDYKGVGNQYVQENKLVTESYLLSTADDKRKDRPNGGLYCNPTEVGNGISSKTELLVAQTLTSHEAKGGDPTSDNYICWEPRSQDGVPRFHGDVAPPLNTAQGGQRQPMVGVRRLTPRECERLQGFPDDWTDGQADATRYKQLGNAVAVPVVEWLARRIIAVSQ